MDTIEYYNSNAEEFFESTVFVNIDELYSEFEKHLPVDAKILDAGCGSGRDTKHFLSKGYSMDAFDASSKMVKLASEYTGVKVLCLSFEDLAVTEVYDGIWCCASLLHIPKTEISDILNNLYHALKPHGVCYVSVKYGESEREINGRFFNDYTPESLLAEFELNTQFSIAELWVTDDNRPDRDEKWVNAIALKDE